MRALYGLPRRRAARTVHPVIALFVALSLGGIVATRLSPAALADPPAGWPGGWVELAPDHARAAAKVNAAYWSVDPSAGAGPPSGTFSFDDAHRPGGASTPPSVWDFCQ